MIVIQNKHYNIPDDVIQNKQYNISDDGNSK